MTSILPPRRHSSIAAASLILLTASLMSGCGRSSTAASASPRPADTTGTTNPAGTTDSTGATEAMTPIMTDVPEQLDGEWLAESFITVGALQPIPEDLRVKIRFPDGPTAEIETVCGHGSALVEFASDPSLGTTLAVGDLQLEPMGECGEGATDVERQFVELLGHPLSWGIDDGRLKLFPTDTDDSGLILRTAASEPIGVTRAVASLVAVAANQRVRMGNGSGTPNVFWSVAVLDTYAVVDDDGILDPIPGAVPVPDQVRRAIEIALGPITVQWVSTAAEVATEPVATWDEQPLPALLTLAEPVIDRETATVVSDLRCGPGCAIGGGQSFEIGADNVWTFVGAVGAQWQS
ncbi:MAG: hypothetical protein ABIR32_03840 [Ilumatobacteraceae bacterium]